MSDPVLDRYDQQFFSHLTYRPSLVRPINLTNYILVTEKGRQPMYKADRQRRLNILRDTGKPFNLLSRTVFANVDKAKITSG